MFKVIRSYLFSPALPAAMLLFGLVFGLAFFQFAGFRWQSSITITLYGGLLVWMALLAWYQRKLWGGIGVIDVLFGTFVLAVLVSLLIQGPPDSGAWKYGRYLPFLVIMPYMYGRLMRASSMQMFFKIVASAGGVMLLLLLLDYSGRLASLEVYSRWPFFGHDFALLLIAMLLAASLIIGSFLFLTKHGKDFRYLALPQIGRLVFLGMTSAALVAVAARGALLAGVMGTLFVVAATRNCSLLKRIYLLLYLVVIMSSAYWLLPKPQTQVYANMAAMPDLLISWPEYVARQRDSTNPEWIPPNRTWNPITRNWDLVERTSNPVLGPDSCRAVDRGINSLAIRWTLYQEAWAIFLRSPVWGVGATSFGRYSCAGEMGFPHSTILQSFVELGMVGGLLYCGLLVIAFFSLLRKAFRNTKTSLAAQLTLSLLVMYLLADQLYGNYFMAAGSYFLIGVAAAMQSNLAWNDTPEVENA